MECLEIHSHLVTLSSTLVFSQITYDWAQREVSGFHERVEAGEESEAEESAPMSGRKPPATASTTAPTTLVMEVEEVGGDLSSRMLDDLSARLQQERAGTVEEAHACTSGNDIENEKDIGIESDYTVCFGVFLRDLRMQRVYLDGYARLHKGHVYLGLILYFVLLLVYTLKNTVSTIAQEQWCSQNEVTEDFWACNIGSGSYSIDEYFRDVLPYTFELEFSALCGFLVLGGVTNWLLHSRFCKKVSEKSWAMLAVFLCPYVGFSIYGIWTQVENDWLWYVFLSLTLAHTHTHLDLLA